ncbi:MAG: putative toxin-antitoxin system toxin component, PIN family [Deltaproteobacteria bacterium]|nr:putative toxin-antitoxin system toxin component, PIN family [Deltaproteobacteria bacterium]
MSIIPKIKVMVDSNVLISSIYTKNGVAIQVLNKATNPPYSLVLCEQILDEDYKFFSKKFPSKLEDMKNTLIASRYDLIILNNNDIFYFEESKIRDITDRPILRAAKKANIDLFITGDRDFLDSSLEHPKIMSLQQFMSI